MALADRRLVAAVDPVAIAVVGGLRLHHDRRARAARPLAVRVDIVDVDAQRLRVPPPSILRALAPGAALALAVADRDQAAAEHELGVRDLAAVAFDLELDLEAEGLAQPVDGGVRVACTPRDEEIRGQPLGGALLAMDMQMVNPRVS